jgi:hypothetical protein
MAYAVFEDEERLTRIFATEQEAWDAAERAGLVETTSGGQEDARRSLASTLLQRRT